MKNMESWMKDALKAARLASKKVIKEHREKRLPIVIWKDGKVQWVKV